YDGPGRARTDEGYANVIGLPRGYGYGASMGAWVLDYAAHWAGDHGFVRHSKIQYRFPPFEGDASILDAEVVDKREDTTLSAHLVTLEVVMPNQAAAVLAKGPVEVQLPPCARVALVMGNRREWVAVAFGVALAGGVLVPVNTYLEAPELAYVLAHSDASVLLMQDSLAGHDYVEVIETVAKDASSKLR